MQLNEDRKVTVVVMGRNYTSRLGMVRAAGMVNCDVDVICTVKKMPNSIMDKIIGRNKPIDCYSKYVRKYYFSKEPDRNALISLLLNNYGNSVSKVVLLPTDDFTASTIDMYQEKLRENFLFPNINQEPGAVTKSMDKGYQKQLAACAGLNTAKGWIIEIKDGSYKIPDNITYPCFPKPQISFMADKHCMKKCDSPDELKESLEYISTKYRNCPVLIEQYISIDKEYAILGFSDENNIYMPYIIEMLESGKGGHYGVTMRGKITTLDQDSLFAVNLSKMIKGLGFTGLFDVDLYQHNEDIYFNELNIRFGASGYSVTASGVNLPELLIDSLLSQDTYVSQKISKMKNSSTQNKKQYFYNEKVGLEDFSSGYISWNEYEDKQKKHDIYFIKNKYDPRPYRIFKFKEFLVRIKRVFSK